MILLIADKKLFLFLDRQQMEESARDELQKAEFEENLTFIEVKDLELCDMRYKLG